MVLSLAVGFVDLFEGGAEGGGFDRFGGVEEVDDVKVFALADPEGTTESEDEEDDGEDAANEAGPLEERGAVHEGDEKGSSQNWDEQEGPKRGEVEKFDHPSLRR